MKFIVKLTLSWRRLLSYRNQSSDLLSKSMDCFLYDNGLRHERVNGTNNKATVCNGLIKRTWIDENNNLKSKWYLNIQSHWRFLITYFGFWLVNILLRKFDTSSKKETKMIKTQPFCGKTKKKRQKSTCKQKVALFTVNSLDWPMM